MSLTPGSTFGRYQIVSMLGSGGMGDVFLAHDTRLNRQVALKLLRTEDSPNSDQLERFVQEARAASALTHPNVAVVHDIGECDGHHFIAMEHVAGRSLADHLRGGPLPTRDLLSIGSQIAEALQAAHAAGIIHRDVKPANVMITAAAQVKVLDFGLAKVAAIDSTGASDETRAWMTGPYVVMGTVAYMSPEQSLGMTVDRRSDLFSLGVVLYEAATGRLPFGGATLFEVMDRLRHREPEPITSLNTAVPAQLDRIVRKCLAKEPAGRYQSAGELLTDLRILERRSDSTPAVFVGDRPNHNLPADLTTFIGRRTEVEHLVELLASARLVTLAGAGGSGKTRLAQQVGVRVAGSFDHGAWFVDLAPTTNPDLLINVVARVLHVSERPGATLEKTLFEWLRQHQLLLILDNCEHLVDACAAFAESALRQAPPLRILATSREALNVPGETVWRVPPLTLPAEADALDPDEMLGFDAIRLFADRAAAVTSFQINYDNVKTVADICRRLDGVPLAIELAAARTKLLSVAQIRERLHDRFRLLAGGGRTAVARQRTLEATVDWSYELLSPLERQLLNRLSVFSSGWTLDAAERVCGGRGIDEGEIIDLLARLVDKSLVIVDDGGVEARYRFLETIRQYARDRLVQSREIEPLAQAHLDYFLALAQEAEPKLIGPDQAAWLHRLDVEHDNLRSAMDWSLSDSARRADALPLALRLWWFWAKCGYFSEGRSRLERALLEQGNVLPDVEARTLIGLVHLAGFGGDFPSMQTFLGRALDAARASGDGWSEAYALDFMSIGNTEAHGDVAESLRLARQARDVALQSTSPLAWQPLALATRLIGYAALEVGRLDEAGVCFEEVLAILRSHGDVWSTGILLTDLAGLRVLQGQHDRARAHAKEGMSCAKSVRDRRGVGWCLHTIAMIEAAAGRARRAAWLYGAGEAVLDSIGAAGQMHVTQVQERYVAPTRETLGETAFRDLANDGRATPIARLMEIDPDSFASV